jgi:thioredoxin-like negative regulator of GroEL
MKFINKFIDVLKTGKVKAGIKAEKYLDRAANDLGKTKAALKLAQIYEKGGEAEKALKEYLLAAVSFSRNRDYPQALTVYKHILKQNPNLDKVALKIGETYGKMGQLENAYSVYGQLLRLYNKQGKENKAAEVMCLMAELSVEKIAIGKQVQPAAEVPHFSKQTSGNATSGNAPQNIPFGGENGRIPFDLEAELEMKPSPEMKRF